MNIAQAHGHSRFPNRSIGEECHDAIIAAARCSVDAIRARKLAERVFDRTLLEVEGKSVSEREAKARTDPRFLAMDDEALEAESKAIVAKAEANGLQVRFEEWRSKQATDRAEMTMR